MSDPLNQDLYYRISDLPDAKAITGEEIVESLQNGVNVKFTLAQLMVSGDSAYQVALENGYIGSQKQWLASLVGMNAYQMAVANGYIGTEADWMLTLVGKEGERGQEGENGKSAYRMAVDAGFEGDEAAWRNSLRGRDGDDGKDGDKGADGKSAYKIAVEHGYEGTEEDFIAGISGKFSKGGAVFITAITPQKVGDNVGEFKYAVDDLSIVECSSTSTNVKVKILALTGFSKYRPVITVNGKQVTLTAKADAPLFEGVIDITLDETGMINAAHDDGAQWQSHVIMDAAPVIQGASFGGGYPEGQSELKAGDKMDISFFCDMDVVAWEIENSGCFVGASGSFIEPANNGNLSGLVVANRGNDTQLFGFRLRVKKANGALSDWFGSLSQGTADAQYSVKLNNRYPAVAFGTTIYPVGQLALKTIQEATVNHTVADFDEVQYTSDELAITDPNDYTVAKKVMRTGGSYNITNKNFNVRAVRHANGAVTTAGIVVAIADVAPTVSISTPAKRLRSGGNAGTVEQQHVITITSSQALAEAPTVNAPEGTWAGAGFVSNAAKTVWTRTLKVHDNNAKGTFSWNSLVAKGLAGQVQNTIDSGADYTLGGFVFRTLKVPAFPNRAVAIGTRVVDTTKLRCTNLSKGSTGTLNFAYQASLAEVANRYSITIEGAPSPTGDTWYNADGANASSNTAGTMNIEIEEAA